MSDSSQADIYRDGKRPLKVLFAASECAPFVKTGGLADVAGALPKTLCAMGHDVRVVLPLYKSIKLVWGARLCHVCDFKLKLGWREQYCGVETLELAGVTYYFIDNEYYFGRDYTYGVFNCDEAERFGFFSKAILEIMPRVGFFPDILHLNDWQTGMAAALLKTQYLARPAYAGIRSLFTVHNLRFQGVFDRDFTQELLSLGDIAFSSEALEYYGSVSYIKGGLVFADRINTVSPTYAREIQSAFFGETLDGLLRARSDALCGILNGIDTAEFDPARDAALEANYSLNDMAGKAACKASLQGELGLDVRRDAVLCAIVSRLTGQKGLDLVERVLAELMQQDIQLVVLGTGEARYEGLFTWAQWRYRGRVAARIEYNEALARRIYAGADIFVMPSLFEPCGLTQMIAMRYGTVPVVRETGGLKDSVRAYNAYENTGDGFSFMNYNAHELLYTVQHVAQLYERDRDKWNGVVRRAMERDFSWTGRAGEYVELYRTMGE